MRRSRPSTTTSTSVPAFNPAASAAAFGTRTPRLLPHLASLTFIAFAPSDIQCISRLLTCPALHPLRTPCDGDDAGARHLDEAEGQHQVDELVDLLRAAGDLEHEAFG